MATILFNLIVKGCSLCCEGSASSSFKNKLEIIAGRFSTLEGFKNATIDSLNRIHTFEGDSSFKKLTPKEENAIVTFQQEIEPDKNVSQNFIKILTKNFLNKQLNMLSAISIESLNASPILCKALNLNTPEELIRYNAYQAIGRSIVTSMGFLVQDLLKYSDDDIYDGKSYEEGATTKWDLVIDRLDDVKKFLEIKSGYNDLDAAQIKVYKRQIEQVEEDGHKGYIGITYGKKYDTTVASGLLRTYLPDWEDRTLVGKELWDFISGNENYHNILMENIEEIAKATLKNMSIVQMIDEKITELIEAFYLKYHDMTEYYESLW